MQLTLKRALPAVAATSVGPWVLANGSELAVALIVAPALPVIATFQITALPAVATGGAGPFALDGLNLSVTASSGELRTFNFAGGNPWTPAAVAAFANPGLDKCSAGVSGGGDLFFESDDEGNGATLTFLGTALAALGLANATGSGNVASLGAVTPDEIRSLSAAAFTLASLGAAVYVRNGRVYYQSNALGGNVLLAFGNNLQNDLGLPLLVTGADGVFLRPALVGGRPAAVRL